MFVSEVFYGLTPQQVRGLSRGTNSATHVNPIRGFEGGVGECYAATMPEWKQQKASAQRMRSLPQLHNSVFR